MWFWRKKQPLLRNYVSETDQFLKSFDARPEATSASRKAEEAKYARIDELRDNSNAEQPTQSIWEDGR